MEEISIRYVCIYLRKSRGDDESALGKHKLVLTELCKEKGWKYVLYEEIMSGDSIAMRPVFIQLLADVENGLYDGCCVMDIDRLGRGNQSDQGRINQAFALSNTYIITPQQIFNLNNDDDEFVVDMKSFISRREYKQIVKRLAQGKKIGSRQGNWTNGTPPYPYEYERFNNKFNEKGLVVNDEKLKIYRYMVDSLLQENLTPHKIAYALNNMNIRSPRNHRWNGLTVYRILIDETHLGKIIANKTKGDGHSAKKPNAKPVEKIPKEKWVVVNNCHEAVKTQDEHDKIILFLARVTKAPHKPIKKIRPYSDLIKCNICGHTIGLVSYQSGRQAIKPCWYVDDHGNKCKNRGMDIEFLNEEIKTRLNNRLIELQKRRDSLDTNVSKVNLQQQIDMINTDIKNKEKSLERILDAFENGAYSLNQFKERKEKVDLNIQQLKEKIDLLELEFNHYKNENIEEKVDKIQYVIDNLYKDNITDEDKNKLYKSVIQHIVWQRYDNDDILIEIKWI